MSSLQAPSLWMSLGRDQNPDQTLKGTELFMILVSMGLLLLTCVETSPVRELAVIAWLVSLALVGLRNIGGALGIYIAAIALYSNHFFRGTFALFERPDHPALLVLLLEAGVLRMKGQRWFSIDWLTLLMGGFLVYGVLNGVLTGTLSAANMGQFSRAFGVPLVLAIMLLRAKPTLREIRSLFFVLFIVAGYSGLVSMLWVTDLTGLMFPAWLNDPTLSHWAGGTRAGGILMQPAWNGLLLSLVFCIAYLAYRTWIMGYGRLLLIALGALLLTGIFLTYTRAAYVGTIPPLLVLYWQRTREPGSTIWRRFVLIVAATVGIAFAALAPSATLESRVGNEGTIVWRLELWKIGVKMVPQRPLLGYGIRGYGENAASFLGTSDILERENLEAREPAIHNTFLNLMIEFGLVGFLLYAAILGALFKRAASYSRKLWSREGVVWVLVFMSVYLIQAQFAVAQEPTTNLIFFCTLALLAAAGYRPGTAEPLVRSTVGAVN